MKKTLLIAAAALISASAFAATNVVSSANIVGYNKEITAENGLKISALQFDTGTSNTPTSVYGDNLPKGSKMFLWNGSGYEIASYTDVFVAFVGNVTKWDANPEFFIGDGYWIDSAGVSTSVLSGNVILSDSVTNGLIEGVNLVSYPYPVDRVITNLGFTPNKGDKIFIWNGTGYDIASYTDVFVAFQGNVTKWDNETNSISVGQGFWYESVSNSTWIANKPF